MQTVIDIPDRLIKKVKDHYVNPYEVDEICEAILNGTPLPKGHGDLIDRSKIGKAIPAEEDNCTGFGMTYDEMDIYNDGINSMWNKLQNADPIIEADKESEE